MTVGLLVHLSCYYPSAITDAIRLPGSLADILYSVGELLLIAGALVCLILLMKAGFDRAEARSKSENGGKKFSSVLCYDFSQPMTLQDRDHMLELCRRIYRETDPKIGSQVLAWRFRDANDRPGGRVQG